MKHDGIIVDVIKYYWPEWEPPEPEPKTWVPCLCPTHDDERASAAINFEADAINCLGCGFKGDALSVIRQMEGGTFADALSVAERIAAQSGKNLQRKSRRDRSRGVSTQPRFGQTNHPTLPVRGSRIPFGGARTLPRDGEHPLC